MVTPELLRHIREQTARGVLRPVIIQELLANGWRLSDIDEGFNSIGSSTSAQKKLSPKHSGLVAAGFVLGTLIVLVGLGYWGATNNALLKNTVLSSIPFLQDQAVTISTSTAGNIFAPVPDANSSGYKVSGGNNTVPTSGYSGGSSISSSISNLISTITQTINPELQGTSAPVCNSFSISPPSGPSGSAATLSWATTNANLVTIDQGVGSVSPASQGSKEVYPSANTTYTATVSNANGSITCQTSFVSNNNPNPSPSVTLSANPTSVNSGSAVNLTWSSTNTNACVGSGFTATGISGTVTVYPTSTQTYSITCSGTGGSASQSVTVSVTQPPTPSVTLSPNPATINPGDSSTLTWTSANVTSCIAVGFTASGTSGSVSVSPSETQTYSITCAGPGGSASQSATVTVLTVQPPPTPTAALAASPTTITKGQSSTLTWSSTNATSCTGSGFTANGLSGSVNVSPTINTTYSVTCTGPGGSASQSATVTVQPPPPPSVTFSANPSTIQAGQSSTLTWSSTHATSCSGTGFTASGTSGSASVSPSVTQEYSITCTGAGGSTAKSATVTVQNLPPAPICTSFTATPNAIISGNSTTLAWQTQNATSVSINNGVGSVTPVSSGTTTVSPPQSTTYVATVSNATGQVTCSATVTVTQNSPTNPFGAFTISSNYITAAKTLDAQFVRKGLSSVLSPSQSDISGVIAAQNAGLQVSMGMNNNSGGVGVPVTDDNAYKAAFVADLTNYGLHPTIITIQNEEDVLNFWSGTPEQYLHMLGLAVQAAHSKGYKITNGGITSEGLDVAYWHHLWLSGDHAGADAFAQVAFAPQVMQKKKPIIGDIPDSNNPDRPIFANDPIRAAKLIRDEILIPGYRATGIDYVNFHWYEVDSTAKIAAVQWLEQTTGLQAMSNEMGIYEADPNHITKTLTGVETLHLPVAIWFNTVGQGGDGPNTPLTDDTGTVLLTNGVAFKSFVDQHLTLENNRQTPEYASMAHTSLLASVMTAISNLWQLAISLL